MAIYEMTSERLVAATATTFASEGVSERYALQRLLRDQIDVIEPGLFVLDEEFSDWDASQRRIDLLCVDRQANLVVVELKVTDDGGHMELQALRYAAMVSAMTFDQAAAAHDRYLRRRGLEGDANARLLEFLGWSSPEEQRFAPDVRVLLGSADFSREITTAVLWLNARGLDIRCVRLRPYRANASLFLDVQQVIPLPEAEDYQIRVRQKEQQERDALRAERTMTAVWRELESTRPAEEVRIARDLEAWLVERVYKIFPVSKGFAQWIKADGRDQYLFKVTTDGQIEVWFQYLASKPPFDNDALREELRRRLAAIPGVDLPVQRSRGKPKFAIARLADPAAMTAFKEVWSWALDQMGAEPSGSGAKSD
jgi:hypothetical protein